MKSEQKKDKWLVTGASGLLGQCLVYNLAEKKKELLEYVRVIIFVIYVSSKLN